MSKQPRRIQRKRTRGWRMPEGAVYVGRPSRWGNGVASASDIERYNPGMTQEQARAIAVARYREWLIEMRAGREIAKAAKEQLAGKDLACWCPLDQPCHADVLLEIANTPTTDTASKDGETA